MLTSELLIYRIEAGVIVPRALGVGKPDLERARTVIDLFKAHDGRRRGELDEALRADEGEGTDYRVRRGLAHLLYSERCEFQTQSILEPELLRDRVFAAAARVRPNLESSGTLLDDLALDLTVELERPISGAELEASLYADLKENQLVQFEPVEAQWLLERYNLAQAQGVLYRSSELVITAHRNDPGEYKLLFRYLKLFGLMHRITGDVDAGYSIFLDGPASLFKPSTRYGIQFAKFLPAILHASKWSLDALIHPRAQFSDPGQSTGQPPEAHFTLDSSTTLKSHYAKGKIFDSILEHSFAERFEKTKQPVGSSWKLEREVDLVDLGGTVMIPDFRLVHSDGRAVLLEIVGFWRADYLRRKFDKLRRSNRRDIVIAVSQKLNIGESGANLDGLEDQIVWFKGGLDPKTVLEAAERLQAGRRMPL
jgi:uncharacterized protein